MIEELAKAGFESFYSGSDLGWKWEGQLEKTKELWRMVIGEVLRKREELSPDLKVIGIVHERKRNDIWKKQSRHRSRGIET